MESRAIMEMAQVVIMVQREGFCQAGILVDPIQARAHPFYSPAMEGFRAQMLAIAGVDSAVEAEVTISASPPVVVATAGDHLEIVDPTKLAAAGVLSYPPLPVITSKP